MQTLEKRSSESGALYDIDCSIFLPIGVTIIGTPTVTPEPVTTPPITVGVVYVNTLATTYTDAYGSTRTVPAGQALQVALSGGSIPSNAQVQEYLLQCKFVTSRAEQLEATVRLRVIDTPAP